jgi:hypothetical protein
VRVPCTSSTHMVPKIGRCPSSSVQAGRGSRDGGTHISAISRRRSQPLIGIAPMAASVRPATRTNTSSLNQDMPSEVCTRLSSRPREQKPRREARIPQLPRQRNRDQRYTGRRPQWLQTSATAPLGQSRRPASRLSYPRHVANSAANGWRSLRCRSGAAGHEYSHHRHPGRDTGLSGQASA